MTREWDRGLSPFDTFLWILQKIASKEKKQQKLAKTVLVQTLLTVGVIP